MRTQDGGHHDAAVAALAAREYERAGDEYTRAAWRVLADPREGGGPFDEKGWVGAGLRHLVVAAVAYRVAGRDGRATRRGVEGVAVARDLRESFDRPVQQACFAEFVADFRVVGDLDGAEAAYEDAAAAYREAGDAVEDPSYWTTTPLFQAAAAPLKQVARGPADGEIAVDWDALHGSDPSATGDFLAYRADYKRRRFPGLVERVVDDGYLAAPRGTTEYDNANHECPACGSTDVNWAGDDVLCLRCSTPVERT